MLHSRQGLERAVSVSLAGYQAGQDERTGSNILIQPDGKAAKHADCILQGQMAHRFDIVNNASTVGDGVTRGGIHTGRLGGIGLNWLG